MLETQRRMRPGISDLIRYVHLLTKIDIAESRYLLLSVWGFRKFLYPNLVDHENVLKYPSIRGMSKDFVFFDHHQKEDRQEQESSSRTNTYEVSLTIGSRFNSR